MAEPTIVCPNCKTEIKLTESLAAPLLEATRKEFRERLAQKESDISSREAALVKAQQTVDELVAQKVKQERERIAADEARKARYAAQTDLEQKSKEVADLQQVLRQRDAKLAEAQKAEAAALRRQREFEDAKRELDLTVEKQVQEKLNAMREQARREVEEGFKLRVAEKEQTIQAMQKQIEELRRKAEQGSQQLQGEVQELELESLLAARFPRDTIEPVPKGEHGGDVLQRVFGPLGQPCGTILWESKRTKHWSEGWLPKLRDDQRAAKAEIAILVSQALPKDVESFDLIEQVYVAHPRLILPLATMVRQALVDLAMARQAGDGQQTKMEMIYAYLTGSGFRHRLQAIAEAFSTMHEDLHRERRAIMKQWAKREQQIERAMLATVGMYGDLQGIAGKGLQEIEGLELEALESRTGIEEDANDL